MSGSPPPPSARLFQRVAALLMCVGASGAWGQIGWNSPEGLSYVISRSYASANMQIQDSCTAVLVNVKPPCPWCDQFDRCKKPAAVATGVLSAPERTTATFRYRPQGSATTQSGVLHDVSFAPDALRLRSAASTTYQNRGSGGISNRGIASAMGRVYFRVPRGDALEYRLTGRMQWGGARGGGTARVQLVGVPNTGANPSGGFGFHSIHFAKGSPGLLAHQARLTPGVYYLEWSVGVDQISHGGEQTVSMDFDLAFGSSPLACTGDRTDTDGDGMPDEWETLAVRLDNGRCVAKELIFPAGAMPDPRVRDIYVELDQMKGSGLHAGALDHVKSAFLKRVSSPNGEPRPIRLHVLVDEEVDHVACVSDSGDQFQGKCGRDGREVVIFDQVKQRHYGLALQRETAKKLPPGLTREDLMQAYHLVFRYALAAHYVLDAGPSIVTGKARGKDFMVAVGDIRDVANRTVHVGADGKPLPEPDCEGWQAAGRRLSLDEARFQAAIFMHELGHTLGLGHGGRGDDLNKPNYFSVMNYRYANFASYAAGTTCTWKGRSLAMSMPIDYSHAELPVLDECALDEADGITRGDAAHRAAVAGKVVAVPYWEMVAQPAPAPAERRPRYRYFAADAGIDWNMNGIEDKVATPMYTRGHADPTGGGCLKLAGHDDWSVVDRNLACRLHFPDSRCGR
jgi:hypothetical protein